MDPGRDAGEIEITGPLTASIAVAGGTIPLSRATRSDPRDAVAGGSREPQERAARVPRLRRQRAGAQLG